MQFGAKFGSKTLYMNRRNSLGVVSIIRRMKEKNMGNFCVRSIRIAIFQKGEGAIPHQHELYQLYHVISGNGRMRLGKQIVELQPDFVTVISPGVLHGVFEIVGENPLRLLNVQFLLDDTEIQKAIKLIPQISFAPRDLLDLLWKVKLEWNNQDMFYEKMASGIFEQYFIQYLRLCKCPTRVKKRDDSHWLPDIHSFSGASRMIVDYIQANYSSEISLQKMSDDLAYSKNYLCKVFKKTTGITIATFVNRYRIEKALELIRGGEKKLIEISDMVGFNDFHYFCRIFKSFTGYSPGEMRDREKFAIFLENQGSPQTIYRYYNKNNK